MASSKILGCIPPRKTCCFCYDLNTGCNILACYMLFSNIVIFMTEGLLKYNTSCKFNHGMMASLTIITLSSFCVTALATGGYCIVTCFLEIKKKYLHWYGAVMTIVILLNIIYALFRILIHSAKICIARPFFIVFLTTLNFIVYVYLLIILRSYAHNIDEENRIREEEALVAARAAAEEAKKDSWKPPVYSNNQAKEEHEP